VTSLVAASTTLREAATTTVVWKRIIDRVPKFEHTTHDVIACNDLE
jgi:hypothetical protein